MFIKKKKKSSAIVILIFFQIVIVLFFLKNTPGLKGDLDQSLKIMLDQPRLFKTKPIYDSRLLDYSIKFFNALSNKIFNPQEFEKINIDIDFKELEKIKRDRKKALINKKLLDATTVNIKITNKQKTLKAKARLKGDLSGHWGNYKQWSLKIQIEDNDTLFSFGEFSLSVFEERDFPNNFLITSLFQKYGILTPRYKILDVTVNGEDWGLMLLEEQFSPSFYAKNKLKEAPILKMTNEKDFELYVLHNSLKNIYDIIKWQGKFETEIFNKYNILKKTNIPEKLTNKNLVSIFKNLQRISLNENKNELFNLTYHFDIQEMAKIVAITSIFGDHHSKYPTNSRYYMNPYDLKVRPILTDSVHSDISNKDEALIFFKSFNNFYKIFYDNKEFQEEYFKYLDVIKNDFIKIKEKFEEICKPFGKNCKKQLNTDILLNNLNFLLSQKNIFNLIHSSNNNINSKKEFNSKNKNNIQNKKIHFRAFDNGKIYIDNLTSEKLRINKLLFKEINNCDECTNKIISTNIKIEPSKYDKVNTHVLSLKNEIVNFDNLEIFYFDEQNIQYSSEELIENFVFGKDRFFEKNENIEEKYISIKGKDYIIDQGEFLIEKPIVIPSGFNLIINKNTKLMMMKDTYIKIINGTINLNGTKDKPIIIDSVNNETWKGIYVYSKNSDEKSSKLNNAIIKNYEYFDDNKIQLTGGINFINSEVKFDDILLEYISAEDAVNFVNSKVEINNLTILNAKSDGVDLDFAEGIMENSYFDNIEGDAIDLSGSQFKLNNIKINNVEDKAISAGEETYLSLNKIDISKSRIAIASKDSSEVFGETVFIDECNLFDISVYQKKSYFGSSKVTLNHVKDCKKPLVQIGNSLILNGLKIEAIPFDVEKLYDGSL